MPVPIAVAPMLISLSHGMISLSRSWSSPSVVAKPRNSCPSVIGTASCIWVRPTLRICENSCPFAVNESMSSRCSSSRLFRLNTIASLMAVG